MSTAAVVDPAMRDQLVLSHVGLVKAVAARLRRRLPSQVELSELVSVGVLGLIDAATRYQPSLGVPFDAYARRRVHGAMLDALRSLDRVPRSSRSVQRRAENLIGDLRQRLGREPEIEEVAEALGISVEAYERALEDLAQTDIGTVRRAGRNASGEDILDLVLDPDHGPHVRFERLELRRHLVRALARLPVRERQILALSYVHELTLTEIGGILGVSESRVSQLRTQAVLRLRSLLRPAVSSAEAGQP